jgi:predicted nucleic acid-binding protein
MEKVRRADEKNKLKFMEKADRRKRLQNDIEHLESALEAEADLFVTSDFALIGKVKSVPRREVELSPQIRKAQEIICTASEALDRIRSSQAI